jgi:hypothetical protein
MSTSNKPNTSHYHQRYFKKDRPHGHYDSTKELVACLNRLVVNYPPKSDPQVSVTPRGGLYHGPVSIAYLFFTLQRIYPDSEIKIQGQSIYDWATIYFNRAKESIGEYSAPDKERCGVINNIMALVAIDAVRTRDPKLVMELCGFATIVTEPDASEEWLCGRAGYLYLLRFVRAHLLDLQDVKDKIDRTSEEIIESIMKSTRPWKWRGRAYRKCCHYQLMLLSYQLHRVTPHH